MFNDTYQARPIQTQQVAVVEWLGHSSSIPEGVDSSPPTVTYILSTCFELKLLTMATLMGKHVICNTRACHCLYPR
jgi:hypothetical protein